MQYKVTISGVTPHVVNSRLTKEKLVKQLEKKWSNRTVDVCQWKEKGMTVKDLIAQLQTFDENLLVGIPSAGGTVRNGHNVYTVRGVEPLEIRHGMYSKKTSVMVCLDSAVISTTAS